MPCMSHWKDETLGGSLKDYRRRRGKYNDKKPRVAKAGPLSVQSRKLYAILFSYPFYDSGNFLKCKVSRTVLSFLFRFSLVWENRGRSREQEQGVRWTCVIIRKWTSHVCVPFAHLSLLFLTCVSFFFLSSLSRRNIQNTKIFKRAKEEPRTDQKEKGSDGSYPVPLSNPLEDTKLKPLVDLCEECY